MTAEKNDTTPATPKKRGGARVGAGRPHRVIAVPEDLADPLVYLQALMVSKSSPETLRLKAAIALAVYKHPRVGTNVAPGKKEQKLLDAAEATKPGSQYAPGRAPLSVVQRIDAAKKAGQ